VPLSVSFALALHIMQPPCQFTYNPRWNKMLLGIVMFGICAVFMAYKASHNREGVIIDEIIHLGPSGAAVFYWVIAVFSTLFLVAGLLLLLRRVANPQILEFKEDALMLPQGLLQPLVTRIQYSDVTSVSESKVSGQTFLCLIARNRRFCIYAALLPDRESYGEIREFFGRSFECAHESDARD
jgi:hypothetical protein